MMFFIESQRKVMYNITEEDCYGEKSKSSRDSVAYMYKYLIWLSLLVVGNFVFLLIFFCSRKGMS
jgi:hypothetical protein